jgi:hypothetical protein
MFKKLIPSGVKWLRSPNESSTRLSGDSKKGVSNPGVRIINGKIEPRYGCELNVVDHCNLTCVDCNHASPAVKKRQVKPETVFRDFSILAKVFRPRVVKVLGGEPLLHPNIISVIEALRASGICEQIRLVTNGLLLPRMPGEFWNVLDELEISIYPDSKIDENFLAFCKNKAIEYSLKLEVFYFNEFRRTFSIPGYNDVELMRRIYRSCKIAHVWGCHVVQEGYFYKCPQSIYIPQMIRLPAEQHTADGIKINDSPEFMEDLYRYLVSPEPLQSCNHCLDNVGKMRPHTMVRPKDWLSSHDVPADQLVDYEQLRKVEEEMGNQAPDTIKNLLDQYTA